MPPATAATQQGYLLLADISGYTSFVAGTELEHGQAILSEMLELIVDHLRPWLTIVKLEGDAVFACARAADILRGESLLELVETTYVAFRDQRDAAQRRTTCECRACRAIPGLDLKFILHFGDYFVQEIAGRMELVGSDVNLIHRLLKNRVSEATGWHAYALLTEACLARVGVTPEGFQDGTEAYEHLGDVKTFSLDLHGRYQEMIEARRVCLLPEQAHRILVFEYHAPPNLIWDWFTEPAKRGLWMHSQIVPVLRLAGRSVAGARNHCVHGKRDVVVEDLLDIRPFDYFTVAHTPTGTSATLLITFRFMPTAAGGTRLQVMFRLKAAGTPEWLAAALCGVIVRLRVSRRWELGGIDGLIAREVGSASS